MALIGFCGRSICMALLLCSCWLLGSLHAQLEATDNVAQQQASAAPDEKAPYRSNWLFYLYEENPHYRFNRLMPFYSYTTYPNRLRDEFWFWPLLAGYETGKSPAPTTSPFAVDFQWYTFPFLTLGNSQLNNTEDIQTTTLVSFLFMTYFQERQVQDRYLARSWYSLPVFSYYHSENLHQQNLDVGTTSWGNVLFSWRDTSIVYRKTIYPAYDWALNPLSLLLGEDALCLFRHARWGRDHLLQIAALDSFSLFSISTTFAQYPGSSYRRFLQSAGGEKGLSELMQAPLVSPHTRLAILSPLLEFETSPAGFFSWQFLPLFRYVAQGQDTHFYLLPLCLELGSDGVRLSPQAKWFPLLYHDEMYGSWDILWPLFRYVQDPALPSTRFTMRLVMDYQRWQDGRSENCYDFSLLERLLLSYQQKGGATNLEVLPAGLLFAYSSKNQEYQWRLLGFGYGESPQDRYLQLLFFKLSLGS